ncbi:MAG: EamA family transporter [Planctomycetes bacterium]|nr:EamA family transporter [Planctomycetota bacterium]
MPTRFVVPFAIGLLCLVWSSTWYGIRICLLEQPPLTSAAVRFLVAGLAMAAVAPRLRAREDAPAPPAWLWLTAGALSFAGSYGILYHAEQFVPSGIAAVLWGIFPLLMAVSGLLFLGERLGLRKLLGMLIAFGGIVTVFGGGLGGIDAGNVHYALVLLLSPVVSAVGTTLIKKFGSGTSSVVLNRNGMLVGSVWLGIAAFVLEDPLAATWSLRGVLALTYLALFGTALTFGIYFWLLRTTPASRLALITYVTPVLAMALGAAVGDGDMDKNAWAGTAAVVFGIGLVVSKGRAANAPAPAR